jgi:hypothetical protein
MTKASVNEQGTPMPIRSKRITFETEFDGVYKPFWAEVCLNVTYGTKLDLNAGGERTEAAIRAIVVRWNFTDRAGNLLPAGESKGVPDELLALLVRKWSEALDEEAKLSKN